MNASKKSTAPAWIDPDDAPDLSSPEWQKKFQNTKPNRGRPKSDRPKISTTLRLDAAVIEHFKKGGKGWQTRINKVLRKLVDAA
jgi:uncharacterized protein (DUF4415 family)